MVEYLKLFKGDGTDFSLNQKICIKLVTDYDLEGCTAHVKFYDYEQTFYPIVDKKLPLSFPGAVTSKFPLGRGLAKIWLTEPNPDGSGTLRRTVENDLKILVTNNIDLLSCKDISYTMLLRYDYKDLDSKPMLNGKVIEGDHTDDYYDIKGPAPDKELSEKSENAVQNKVIAGKFKEMDETVSEHINAKSGNPHGVTAEQVGLGNVDNTADADKPVSVHQQEAIAAAKEQVANLVQAEARRATGREQELQNEIDEEGRRASSAETNLDLAIRTEKERAQGAEADLGSTKQDKLSSQQLAAVNSGIDAGKVAKIAQNESAISAEVSRATTEEARLQELINAIKTFDAVVADSLPSPSEQYSKKLVLVPSTNPEAQNVKDEFICVKIEDSWSWEQVGSTAITIEFDDEPTEGSQKAARSGGIWSFVNGIIGSLTLGWENIIHKPFEGMVVDLSTDDKQLATLGTIIEKLGGTVKASIALLALCAATAFGYTPEAHTNSFERDGVTYAQRGGLGASDYVVTNIDASAVGKVKSVNGRVGDVVLDAAAVNALPDDKDELVSNDNFKEAVATVSPPVELPAKWALANVTNAYGKSVRASDVGALGN